MLQRGNASRLSRNGFKGIAASLQEQIESGGLASGHFLPTERELQEVFGASRSTVRRALAMLVENGWAKNVPSKGVVAGNGVRPAQSNNIALIDGSTFVMGVLMAPFSEMLRDLGYHLVHTGGKEGFLVEEALRYAETHGFAGALVWPYKGFPDTEEIARITRRMPVVFMDTCYRGVDADVVSYDHVEAGDIATEHLIRAGRQRIGVTGFLDMMASSHDALSGYMRAMFRNDLNPEVRDFIFTFTSGMSRPDTHNLVERLKAPDRPDALFVLQDILVPDTIEAVRSAGLRVPEDIAITTIGDDVSVDIDGIGLTAVAIDWESMARTAIQLLVRRIEDPTRTTRRKDAPTRLIVRGTCGTPHEQWINEPDHRPGAYPRQRYRFSSSPSSSGANSTDNSLNAEAYH